METLEILVVGTHLEILKVILRLIHANPLWKATGCSCVSDAKDKFFGKDFDLVLLGAGLTEYEESELTSHFKRQKPDVRIVKHYGGGSGLLFAEIYQAMQIL